jgi:hypothetical protein
MSSVVVIIPNIFEAEPYQMSLVERDHVIQHLTADAPHPSFRDSVLPRTANARPDSFDPARFQKATHLGAEFAVTIKDDVAIGAWKRQGLSDAHGRRQILHFNVTRHPTADWVVQQLREAFPEAGPLAHRHNRRRVK